MALKKDKQKVLGEIFDDARVKSFLTMEGRDDCDIDFLRLERAYRSMNAENFTTFLKFFIEAGYNINAKGPQDMNLLQITAQHAQAHEYNEALKKAGAHI